MKARMTDAQVAFVYGAAVGAALMFVAGIIDRRFFTTTEVIVFATPKPQPRDEGR